MASKAQAAPRHESRPAGAAALRGSRAGSRPVDSKSGGLFHHEVPDTSRFQYYRDTPIMPVYSLVPLIKERPSAPPDPAQGFIKDHSFESVA